MTPPDRPLLLTADPELLDDLLGLAGAAGVAVDVATEPAVCRPQWTAASLVLVGADLAGSLPAVGLRSRPDVLLVGRETPTEETWEIATAIGAEKAVSVGEAEADLLDRLADTAEPATKARVIGVVPGRGGAGASVLAAGLALTAATAGPSWLIDLDPLGGGSDAGLGVELEAGARWCDLGVLSGRLSSQALRAAVPEVRGVAVVAATPPTDDLAPEAVRTVVRAAGSAGGTVVLDLSRHRTAARDAAVVLADDLLIVVPSEIRAVLATRRVVETLGSMPRAVVRTVPGALPAREVIRGVDLPFAGELADEVAVRAALQVGDAAGLVRETGLAALCANLLDPAHELRAAA